MSHESNDAESGITACERVAHTLSGALPAPRKRRAACLDRDDTSDEQVRALDRAIRWNTFLFAVNLLWADIVKLIYGDDIDMDSNIAIDARNKIFDNTKTHK
jgi:hypothetical protein